MNTLLKRLHKIAYFKSNGFCSSCYKIVNTTHCKNCGSDDLMRSDINGVDWGTDHVVKTLLEELEIADIESAFELYLEELHSEPIKISYLELNVNEILKQCAPNDYEYMKSEYISYLIEDEQILDIFGKYYWESDVDDLVEGLEAEIEEKKAVNC